MNDYDFSALNDKEFENLTIVASDDEIREAWNSLPSVMKKIPLELISKGLARMCIAVSAGLFDSAVNYIWNASTIELRNKIIKSGSNIKKEYFKGLVTLAKILKDKPFKGIILYGGNEVLPYKMDEFQFWVIPLKSLM